MLCKKKGALITLVSVLTMVGGLGIVYGQGPNADLMDEFPYPFSEKHLGKKAGATSSGDHENVELIGRALVEGPTGAVDVQGKYAYIGAGCALVILDVSTPSSPIKVGRVVLPSWACDVFVSGAYAYVAARKAGLRVIDVSDPASPYEVGFYDIEYAMDVFVSGNYAYVSAALAGLRIIDISDPTKPFETGFYDTVPYAKDVFVSGSYAYVTGAGLQVIDISDPAKPFKAGFCNTYDPQNVFVSGNYAYVADWWAGLRVIDITDPTKPFVAGSYDTSEENALGEEALSVFVSGNYAYVTAGQAGLRVIDISDPTSPFEVGFSETVRFSQGVFVSGDYAYVAADYYGGLRVIDIFDPAEPSEVGFFDTQGSNNVFVSGDYAYVGGLRVIDISNPAEPSEVGFCDTEGSAEGVFVSGNYAYVAAGYYGLRVIDVSDPTSPFEVGFYDIKGYVEGLFVSGGYVYVPAWGTGLYILRFTGAEDTSSTDVSCGDRQTEAQPQRFLLEQNLPNPFNAVTVIGFQMPHGIEKGGQSVSLRIYNVSGQLVRTLIDGRAILGNHRVVWDGNDDLGREASSGVYLYHLTVDGGRRTKTKKMVLIR